ncbi:MAG TPA: outer membrane beta-barrel protein [Gammaproteobacteria bacterium]|nr:outer membrane beta-barrel protein [Gammaproteobacteria bacterium]
MRRAFAIGAVAACLFVPSIAAAAADTGWYIGYSQGQARASEPPPYSSQTFEFQTSYGGVISDQSSDQQSTGKRFEGGYWFNPYLGLQAGVVDLGDYSAQAMVHAGGQFQNCQGPTCNFRFIDSPRVKVRGQTLVVTGAWPFAGGFEVIGRLGVFRNRATYDDSGNVLLTPGGAPPAPYSIVRNGTGSIYGISVGWNFATHWEVLLAWDRYRGIGDDQLFGSYVTGNLQTQVFTLFGKFDVSLLSLGAQYHF